MTLLICPNNMSIFICLCPDNNAKMVAVFSVNHFSVISSHDGKDFRKFKTRSGS